MTTAYRPEIDGLRALAVLPVLFFHAGFAGFAGGFVGVDVFFVISGYLITSIILDDLRQGRFSLARFYERRVRRLYPALVTVTAACLPAAWLLLQPHEMKRFGQGLFAVSIFASNILFWKTTGYFETDAELKPLLHTWSLAVEEQYYLLFPLALIVLHRHWRLSIATVLLVVGLASLAAAQWGSLNQPTAAFYLLHTRAWELLAGAWLAARAVPDAAPAIPRRFHGALAGTGLGLIAASVVLFTRSTPAPGLYTLAPVLGTVLVIAFARAGTWAHAVLSQRVVVSCGLISYSLYLWHQPVFAFARHRSLDEPSTGMLLMLVLLCLVLAYLTWKYVERPFRTSRAVSRRAVFALPLATAAVLMPAGLAWSTTQGYFLRDEAYVAMHQRLATMLRVNRGLSDACEETFRPTPACRTSDAPEIVVWGDSFAMHLVQGIQASRPGVGLVQATVSVCGPFFDAAPVVLPLYGLDWARRCIESNDRLREYLKRSPSIRHAVLASPFTQYVGKDARLLLRDGTVVDGPAYADELFRLTLQQLSALGITPVVFAPPPRNGNNIGACLAKAVAFGEPLARCDFPLADASRFDRQTDGFLARLGTTVAVIRPADGICPDSRCRAARDDVFLYRDGGHLSHDGSAGLGRQMDFYRRIVGAAQLPTARP